MSRRRHVYEVRRTTDTFARDLGMSIGERGRVLIQVTEAATNLLHHAVGGEIFVSALERGPFRAIEILALDRGPGIQDVEKALAGGASSRGSLGEGLGAIRRLADDFDLETSAKGTVIFSRTWSRPVRADGMNLSWEEAPRIHDPWSTGGICRAKPGQDVCGDGWIVVRGGPNIRLAILADGLGHGPGAAEAAEAMIKTVRYEKEQAAARRTSLTIPHLLESIHQGLRSTRGAAVSIARLDDALGQLTFAGVGNVSGAVIRARRRKGLVTHNGTAGSGALRIQEFEQEWPPGAVLVLHTDGVSSDWDLASYPGLVHRDPSLVAGVIYRDHGLKRDDASVLVLSRQDVTPAAP